MTTTALKDRIALRALDDAPHYGWDKAALRRAAVSEGQSPQMADALFTGMDDATRLASLTGLPAAPFAMLSRASDSIIGQFCRKNVVASPRLSADILTLQACLPPLFVIWK